MSTNRVDGQNNSIIGTTIKAGALGAGSAGVAEYLSEKYLLKHPDIFSVDNFTKEIEEGKKYKFLRPLSNRLEKNKDKFLKFVESGKINKKEIAKFSAYGAAAFAGIYLIGKGIKTLFSKKD